LSAAWFQLDLLLARAKGRVSCSLSGSDRRVVCIWDSVTKMEVLLALPVKASNGMRKVSIGGIVGAPEVSPHPGIKTRIVRTSNRCIRVLPLSVFIDVLLRSD
jgi:hypothetical protein